MTSTSNITNRQAAIAAITAAYNGITLAQIEQLIEATNGIGGVSFVKVRGYSSDKSGNTEVADQLINIGAAYANMVKKDADIYANFDLESVDIERFDYSTIDTGKLSLEDFKTAVKLALPVALAELNEPKAKRDTSADIWLNKALVFNLNTMRLAIFGQSINKVVETKGEFKKVKSAPKTVAKRLIEKQAKGKAQTLRRFALDNFDGSIKVAGETCEIG